ncbi:hypothetical protein J2S53_000519 [Actinopolyspora lacussalsi]|nr:hypothetical protein [Actinopolyspora lacussalsi]
MQRLLRSAGASVPDRVPYDMITLSVTVGIFLISLGPSEGWNETTVGKVSGAGDSALGRAV